MGGGEGQSRIVRPQAGQELAALADDPSQILDARVRRGPRDERGRELGPREGRIRIVVEVPVVEVPVGSRLGDGGRLPRELPGDQAQPDEQRQPRIGRRGPGQQRVEPRVFERARDPVGPERDPPFQGDDEGRQQLPVRAGEERPCPAVVGPGVEDPAHAIHLVRVVGGQDEPSGGPGSGPDHLRESLLVALDEANGPGHHRAGAAVVRHEVDPAQAGQAGGQVQDPSHVGQPPTVDGLVVVADHEDPVGRRRQEEGHPELAAVDVLDLVDEEVGTGPSPAIEDRSIGIEQADGPRDEVVEVDATECRDGPLIGHERPGDEPRLRVPGDIVGRHAQVELEARDRIVESGPGRRPGRRRHQAQDGQTLDDRHVRPARGPLDLEAQGVERPDPDGAGLDAQRRQGRVQPLGQLVGRTLVEGDGGDGRGGDPSVDEPRDPGDEGRGLATPGGGDAQQGTGRGRGGRPLVGCEPGEPLGDGRVERVGVVRHQSSVASRALPAIHRPSRICDVSGAVIHAPSSGRQSPPLRLGSGLGWTTSIRTDHAHPFSSGGHVPAALRISSGGDVPRRC